MSVRTELIREAVKSISSVQGLSMPVATLAEDAFLLSVAFPDEAEYLAACANTRRALEQLVSGSVQPSSLKHDFEGWKSFHYQHRVGQGMRATCRIVYRSVENGIEVLGFGHRSIPLDFYSRLRANRI